MVKGLKDPIKTDEGSKGERRESANQNEDSKKPKTDLQTCTQQHINFAYKTSKKSKKNTGKAQNTLQALI